MYGTEQTKAFCCNCKKLTLHKYTMFSSGRVANYKEGSWWKRLFGWAPGPMGDYKCTVCGTYLHTPDNLDYDK